MQARATPRIATATFIVILAALLAALVCDLVAARSTKLQQQKARATEVVSEVTAIDGQLTAIVAEFATTAQRLDYLRAQVKENEHDLEVARYQLSVAEQTLSLRAVAMYKNDQATLLDVVFDTKSFDDLLTKIDYLGRLGASDVEVLHAVEDQRREVAAEGARLEKDVTQAEAIARQQATIQTRLQDALARRQALLKGIREEVARLQREARERARQAAQASQAASVPAAGFSVAEPVAGEGAGRWWPYIQESARRYGFNPMSMYRMMMLESGGSPTICGGGQFYGLFQYYTATWKASWNPWRNQSIVDGVAQIRATGLALSMGKGPYWWPNTYPLAFGSL